MNALPHCRYIERQAERGSAAIRNFLARESRYEWLLYIDCDLDIPVDHFLQRYLETADEADVTMGGIAIGGEPQTLDNLRYTYEKAVGAATTRPQPAPPAPLPVVPSCQLHGSAAR